MGVPIKTIRGTNGDLRSEQKATTVATIHEESSDLKKDGEREREREGEGRQGRKKGEKADFPNTCIRPVLSRRGTGQRKTKKNLSGLLEQQGRCCETLGDKR